MSRKAIPAVAKGAPTLTVDEQLLVQQVIEERPSSLWSRFKSGMASAAKVIFRDEFDRVCSMVVKELDGQAITPDEAAKRARRIIIACTQAEVHCICPKCDISETAVLVVFLGHPKSGFLFQRAIRLKDPKGAKRG
jgi:hypothetical protein